MRRLAVLLSVGFVAGCSEEPGQAAGKAGGPTEVEAEVAAGPVPGSPEFAPYAEAFADSEVTFDMVPIPGGVFTMGSPEGETGRADHEGPQVEVKISPFWMGRCEVTWDEFDRWHAADLPQAKKPDGTSKPTPEYTDMTFNMGRDGYPAICMSHVAARQYCVWLSRVTGKFYRLPTEAEWEYACRAGADTAYSFGDDPAALGDHAWFVDNAEEAYHQVGQKKPNAWGLFDMHGNVAEWVADGYEEGVYAEALGAAPRVNPFFPPAQDKRGRPIRFPHVLRGGSWQDAAGVLRSSARRVSEKSWNRQDPQIPKSWWYLTDGQLVGFRIVRPFEEPSAEERARFEQL